MLIKSPSRLHLGLIDMNGSYGRLDGGIGLTIQDPNLILFGEPAEKGITVDFNENFNFNETIRNECITKITKAALASINSVDGGQSAIENPDVDRTVRRDTPKVGRNDPCPCGSGKKYKNCCGKNQ